MLAPSGVELKNPAQRDDLEVFLTEIIRNHYNKGL